MKNFLNILSKKLFWQILFIGLAGWWLRSQWQPPVEFFSSIMSGLFFGGIAFYISAYPARVIANSFKNLHP